MFCLHLKIFCYVAFISIQLKVFFNFSCDFFFSWIFGYLKVCYLISKFLCKEDRVCIILVFLILIRFTFIDSECVLYCWMFHAHLKESIFLYSWVEKFYKYHVGYVDWQCFPSSSHYQDSYNFGFVFLPF